jgi:hypothetical protein
MKAVRDCVKSVEMCSMDLRFDKLFDWVVFDLSEKVEQKVGESYS